jgi:pyrroloquinoline quinone (PQQ) biosynthesis protein C
MVARYAGAPDAEETAVGAVEEACDALWGFLDGCYREFVEVAA